MPTNVFFSPAVRSEQNLYEDIIIEALQMYGQDVMYIPREKITTDEILNEDYSQFTEAYAVEMYIANTDGFEGEGTLLSKFGIEIRDQATFIVAKRRFRRLVEIDQNAVQVERPREGDLIYLPLANSLFQIKFVEHEQPFYRLNDLPIYEINCELFEYSSELINTPFEAINQFEREHGSREVIELSSGSVGFRAGEFVYQQIDGQTTVTGEVADFVETQKLDPEAGLERTANLALVGVTGSDGEIVQFDPAYGPIYRAEDDSMSDWTFVKTYDLSDPDNQFIPEDLDEFADNTEYEIQSDSILDFSEQNPFGDPREEQ
jgi:hypothetical protein